MKVTLLLSLTAVMAFAAAQTEDITADPSDVTYADPTVDDSISTPINWNYDDTPDEIIDQPSNEMPDKNDDLDDSLNDNVGSSKSGFTAWSSPGYKGHRQHTKHNTKGCYRLSGGAVGSFEGSNRVQYGFYKDDKCRGRFLFGSSSAPVRRIDPIIHPRSVKMFEADRPDPPSFGLVAWSRPNFYGNKQLVRGMGCQAMDGSDVYSFQGEYKYKFYKDRYCYEKKLLETSGGKSTVPKMNPRSVYIYK
ncbi:hypothetical protein BGZ83_011211 [Gryganskiella cystojenkinii]|nr:hypothetical protein BGZ83_011211 [Gryganskiella cystojenkinii]